MIGYKTSTDYTRLKVLLDEGRNVIVLSPHNSQTGRPGIGIARKEGEHYILGNILTWSEEYPLGCGWNFEPYCDAHKIEFIEPDNNR